MKKPFSCFIVLTVMIATGSLSYADSSKMDGLLKITKSEPYIGKSILGKAVSLKANYETVDCLVKTTNPTLTAKAINDAGGEARAILGDIMTASIPLDALEDISDREEVVFMEAAKPLSSKMNYARSYTYVTEVQQGTGLSQSYNGSNVLVGIVDNTLDWQNEDFQGSDNETRICYIHQQTTSGGLIECTKSEIDDGTCSASQGGSGYHGTHVTGIAAGSNNTYTGVAPEGYIAFGFTTAATDADSSGSFSTVVLEAVLAIFSKADSLDMPSVINLSLGTSLGAHDDTSLFEQGLNNAVSGKQGRAIVNAAGNENLNFNDPNYSDFGGIHGSINVTSGTDEGWKFAIRDAYVSAYGSAIVDIWPADTSNCRSTELQVMAYRATADQSKLANAQLTSTAIDFTSDNQSLSNTTADGKVNVDVYTFTSNSQNGRPHAYVIVTPTSTGSWSDIAISSSGGAVTGGYYFDVIFRPTSGTCRGEMWLYPDQTSLIDFFKIFAGIVVNSGANMYQLADGDSNRTITIPGTASGVITAGSYMGRGTWTDINGNTHNQDVYDPSLGASGGSVDTISPFSSLGPTGEITGSRTKPDIVAPGEPIISTKALASTFNDELLGDADHVKLEGTSMSSPHIAGIVALLMEKNNCLTASELKTALTNTATAAGSSSPNNTYGYGKVNALLAIQNISANTSCYSGDTCNGGSSGGGSGCGSSIIVPVAPATGIVAAIALLAPAGILIIRRRRR